MPRCGETRNTPGYDDDAADTDDDADRDVDAHDCDNIDHAAYCYRVVVIRMKW